MRFVRVLTLALMCAGFVSVARAADATVDDIITLAQKNLGDDVLIAQVEASNAPFSLKANDIVRLKEAKISDKVIAAMIRHNKAGGAAPVAVAPAAPAVAAPQPVPVASAPVAGATVFGVLNIENLDEKTWSYRFEPDTQTIWISTSATDGRGNVQAHGGVSIRMPSGAYNVRYNGQDRGQKVSVFENEKSLLMISRVETAEVEALYVSVFERGERKASGRLVTLRENAAPREDNVIRKSSEAQPIQQPQQQVVEVQQPPTVIYRDAPTYIYTQPSVIYSSGYYGGGYYGNGYSYPRTYGGYYGGSYYGRSGYSVGGSYYSGGRHNGFSVGVGFRN